MTGDISIILLAKNEEKFIASALDMVFGQTRSVAEVILIDSGSRDSTLAIAGKYPVKLCRISPGEFGHGRTRNLGARLAGGEFLVFLNADAVPRDENWLEPLSAPLAGDTEIAGAYSRILPRPGCNPLRAWEIDREFGGERAVRRIDDFSRYRRMDPREKRQLLAFPSISCCIRRKVLLENPFKDMEFGEDLEWSKRVMEKGLKIVFEPASAVFHSHDFYLSPADTFRKYFDDGKLNQSLLRMWTGRRFPLLAAHMGYKMSRDARHILSSDRSFLYKLAWLLYSPVVRAAEFAGTAAGIGSACLPRRFHSAFSLAHKVKVREREVTLP